MRAAVQWLVFPTLLIVAIGGAIDALTRGFAAEAIVAVVFVGTVVLVTALERLLPYRAAWNERRGDLAADAVYLPLTGIINGLIEPAAKLTAVGAGAWLSATFGSGLWPSGWPLLAQLVLACVVGELFDYFAHRVMHQSELLWRLHATHHSAPRLYWLNATRSHPGEMLFRGAVAVLPLAGLGAGEPVFVLIGVVNIVVGFFQHANIDFHLGPLSWIFSIGELHRWHHSRARGEADSNYGNNFIFWDAAFGTRYRPPDRQPPERVGIDGLDGFPSGVVAQILAPLRWERIEAASRSPAVAGAHGSTSSP